MATEMKLDDLRDFIKKSKDTENEVLNRLSEKARQWNEINKKKKKLQKESSQLKDEIMEELVGLGLLEDNIIDSAEKQCE